MPNIRKKKRISVRLPSAENALGSHQKPITLPGSHQPLERGMKRPSVVLPSFTEVMQKKSDEHREKISGVKLKRKSTAVKMPDASTLPAGPKKEQPAAAAVKPKKQKAKKKKSTCGAEFKKETG